LQYAAAILFALFVWWFSTGAVLYLVGLPRRLLGISMTGATAVLALALAGLAATSDELSVASAYCAFTCGLLIWAWHEMSFLTGFLTGPRKSPCPEGSSGWRRFACAINTLLYHELAVLMTGVALVLLTWGAPNQIGVWTFMVLWVMRLSAKLNIYLGVPNVTEHFLPDDLAFLKSYFARAPMNILFPISVTAATVVTLLLILQATAPEASGFTIAGFSLLATLMALAVLEHWLLVLPLPAARLWNWGLKSRDAGTVAMRAEMRHGEWDGDQAGHSTRPEWTKAVVKDKTPLAPLPGR
jgi:putative photosynthetic complex assembly protein 2